MKYLRGVEELDTPMHTMPISQKVKAINQAINFQVLYTV